MQKDSVLFGLVTLIIGLGVGYSIGIHNAPTAQVVSVPANTHMMPNGEVMSNAGSGAGMAGMMQDMNAALRGKTGDAFDQAFLSEMIVHHQGAVDMAQLALANAKHQEIKNLANAIIAAQNKEIAEMKDWQQSWYGTK